MAENKTKATQASVDTYLAGIVDLERRSDCVALTKLMTKITGQGATMWGNSIVGFGSYHYRYDSGREGDACATGFSARKSDISVYLSASGERQEKLLAQLGRHKMGKACLSIRRLSEVDVNVLEQLVVDSVAEIKRRYG